MMNNKCWLTESDKEVEAFHPVCEEALNRALELTQLSGSYRVEHHRYVGSLEMDFVVSNRTTGKVFCVIEVKRTIPAVYSSRYQYQAMSYVQSLRDTEKETNYYILTNLECSCMFKYSTQKPNVYDQMLQPGVIFNHRFSDVTKDEFINDLVLQFKDLLLKIQGNYSDYVLSFGEFASLVRSVMPSRRIWNSSIAFMFYEYIRGAFSDIGRNELFDIRQFRNDIAAICREASQVNFKGIFGLDSSEYDTDYIPAAHLLVDLFKLGKNYKDADEICNIMHQVISAGRLHDGEVPTDIELAQTLVSLVKTFVPGLVSDQMIADPAAGSGTLLSAAVAGYGNIQPHQILANDINPLLLQLLSLRLGLHFAATISTTNSPGISISDIATLSSRYFENTKVIVLNPPYLSATAEGCVQKKEALALRISTLLGRPAKTNGGQAALECLFLELVTALAKPDTVIACIIPNTHLSALGPAEVAFRQFLLEDFGLAMIFNYPQTNLFEDVVQNTSIVIGIAHEKQNDIKVMQSLSLITEINQDDLNEAITKLEKGEQSKNLIPGLIGNIVSSSYLSNKVSDGWKELDPVIHEVSDYSYKIIEANHLHFVNIKNSSFAKPHRGKVGNEGGSDLLYISSNKDFFDTIKESVEGHLKAGLRNSDFKSFFVGDGDESFFDVSGIDEDVLSSIVSIYSSSLQSPSNRQSRRHQSENSLIKILKTESSHFVPENTVLLPRATRKYASVYITTKQTYLSTNFFAIECDNLLEAKVLASWMSSIFYQLQLERFCKNQGGMRKLERKNIMKTFVPIYSELSKEVLDRINNLTITDFYNLKNPSIREVDKIWASIIGNNDNSEYLLNKALRYMTVLAKNRES